MFYNANRKFSLHAPDTEGGMTVTGDGGGTPGGDSHGRGGGSDGGANVGEGGTMTDTINGVTLIFEGVHALDDPDSSGHRGGDSSGGNNGDSSGGSTLKSSPGHPTVIYDGVLSLGSLNLRRFYTRVGKDSIFTVDVNEDGSIAGLEEVATPGDYNNPSWASRRDTSKQQVTAYLKDEKDFLLEASGIIADAGEKISQHIGGQYKRYADEVANNIRNFQGRTIRGYNDALASFNNIMSNPSMKVKQGDKEAIINAMRAVNAQDMANRFGHFGKFFKTADKVLKIEKIREKSIEGYETGNWAPLVYEVEAMVLSGVAAAVAIGFVTGVLSMLALLGVPVLATSVLAIGSFIAIAYYTSRIDAAFSERFNNEVVRPAN